MFHNFKLTLLFLVSFSCMHVQAEDYQFLTNVSYITNATDGAFKGAIDQMFLEDMTVCFNYSVIVLWDGVDAIKYMFIDPTLAVESIGLIVHKLPIVYMECNRIIADEKYTEFVFQLFNGGNDLNLMVHLYENFVFNIGDVFQNMFEARQNLATSHFTEFGENIGHIVTDFFYLNPVDEDIWDTRNSHVAMSSSDSVKI